MKALLSLLLVALLFQSESIATPKPLTSVAGDSIVIQKKNTRRSHKIALYPDASQKVLFFNVRGLEGKVYQLYVFDMNGNVIKQAETRNKQTTLIKNIDKGVYLFEVFSNDDRIGNGHIAVR
jgi:hypothetical protein